VADDGHRSPEHDANLYKVNSLIVVTEITVSCSQIMRR
jgi:hypothetical protein